MNRKMAGFMGDHFGFFSHLDRDIWILSLMAALAMVYSMLADDRWLLVGGTVALVVLIGVQAYRNRQRFLRRYKYFPEGTPKNEA